MSKAEERALEKYPLMADDDKEGLEALKYIGMKCECSAVFNEVQEAKQAYFIEGYHQAEKDFATAYVVTRCEEHSDYVEDVFFDEDKAQEYCDQFKGDENEYARHITKVKVTL